MPSNYWTPKDYSSLRQHQTMETGHLTWYFNYHDPCDWQRRRIIDEEVKWELYLELARQPLQGILRLWGVIATLKATLAFLRLARSQR